MHKEKNKINLFWGAIIGAVAGASLAIVTFLWMYYLSPPASFVTWSDLPIAIMIGGLGGLLPGVLSTYDLNQQTVESRRESLNEWFIGVVLVTILFLIQRQFWQQPKVENQLLNEFIFIAWMALVLVPVVVFFNILRRLRNKKPKI